MRAAATGRWTRTTRGHARPPLVLALATLSAVWLVSAAHAQQEPEEESPGWTPSLSLGFGITSQGLEGTSQTDLQTADGGTVPIGAGESNELRVQYFEPSASLYAPPIWDGGWAPRLFVHGGLQVPLSDGFIAQNYVGTFGQGDDLDGNCPAPAPRTCVVKSKNSVSLDGNWFVGIGVDLTLPVSRRQFHLRPSIDYFGQSWKAEGEIERTSTTNPPGQPLTSVFESIDASSDTQIMHGVGPRLQFILELAEVGQFGVDLFLETQFYWIVSDNAVQFTGSSADGNASFVTEVDSFVGQGGGGVRIVWKGD
jgi:hypothetical protein